MSNGDIIYDDGPDRPEEGRPVSDNSVSVEKEKDTVQLTDLSVRAIGLYQKQAELTDRLWSYFGTISSFAALVALAAPLLAKAQWLPARSWYTVSLLVLIVLGYFAFTIGNRLALKVSQEALERIAAQAQVASGIGLDVIKPAKAVLFHRLVSLLVLAIMVVGFVIAIGELPVVNHEPHTSG